MATKIAINGFGRIGRLVLRRTLESDNFDIVAINDLTDAATLAHLLKYDSVHGILNASITADDQSITVNGDKMRVLKETDPAKLPWKELGAEIVVEAQLEKVEGRRMTFTVSASDHGGLVAAGKVTRVTVDRDRFLGKCCQG